MRQKLENPSLDFWPMTLEGCVVRIADTISYIGRDIEDAIRLGLIDRAELPETCKKRLGDTNGTIVYSLVADLVATSPDQLAKLTGIDKRTAEDLHMAVQKKVWFGGI